MICTNPSEVPNIIKPLKYRTMLTVWSLVCLIKTAYSLTPSQLKRYPPTQPIIILFVSQHQTKLLTGIPTKTLVKGTGTIDF